MARRSRKQKLKITKDAAGVSALVALAVIVLFIFIMPKPLNQENAAIIAKDALISDPILKDLHARINIAVLDVEDSGIYWRVIASVSCKPTAERAKLCVPSELVEKGVYSIFIIYVDKLNGQSTIIYPKHSIIAKF